jgi:hypothetical protein
MARGRVWVYDPHSGGVKIPPVVRQRTAERIEAYAKAHDSGRFLELDIRFKGALCYIDAFVDEPDQQSKALQRTPGETRDEYVKRLRNALEPLHLCRLRFFRDENSWSMAFYTYSHNRYGRATSTTAATMVRPRKPTRSGRSTCETGDGAYRGGFRGHDDG